jgi:hypothetical protein
MCIYLYMRNTRVVGAGRFTVAGGDNAQAIRGFFNTAALGETLEGVRGPREPRDSTLTRDPTATSFHDSEEGGDFSGESKISMGAL